MYMIYSHMCIDGHINPLDRHICVLLVVLSAQNGGFASCSQYMCPSVVSHKTYLNNHKPTAHKHYLLCIIK